MMGMFHAGHQGMIKLFLLMLVRYLLDIAIQVTYLNIIIILLIS